MSTDKVYNERESLPFYLTYRPRFWGAGSIENIFYALCLFLEAAWLLLNFWNDKGCNFTMHASDILHDIFYQERTEKELQAKLDPPKEAE